MSDLAEQLRDWQLELCAHRSEYSTIPCCSPCLRDRILASEWLAKVKAKAAAEEDERLADMASSVFDRSFFLRRADRIAEGAGIGEARDE